MKTIEVKLYNFNELSEDAKLYAIEQKKELMYKNDLFHIIDDCYLLEPNHLELCKIIPYYEKLDRPIIKNNRKIYYDLDRYRHIDASEAIEINYQKEFLLWLGIPENMHEKIYYKIESTNSRYPDTIITFDADDIDELTDNENKILENASSKFSDHMEAVLKRIEDDYDYYFSDESISQELEDFYLFTEDGKIYN